MRFFASYKKRYLWGKPRLALMDARQEYSGNLSGSNRRLQDE